MNTSPDRALKNRPIFIRCLILLCWFFIPTARAATLLIWPVHVVFTPDQRSVDLWLENRSENDMSLQIRIFEWAQSDNADKYQPQTMLVASPPFSTMAGGKKQLIRLVRVAPGEVNREYQFRILIDEIPRKDAVDDSGVQFQMRYSVPVFFQRSIPLKNLAPYFSQHLKYRIADGRLQVYNDGEYSARISRLSTRDKNNEQRYLTNGLLGYVLPGATMSWAFEYPVKNGLFAEVNNSEVELNPSGLQ